MSLEFVMNQIPPYIQNCSYILTNCWTVDVDTMYVVVFSLVFVALEELEWHCIVLMFTVCPGSSSQECPGFYLMFKTEQLVTLVTVMLCWYSTLHRSV